MGTLMLQGRALERLQQQMLTDLMVLHCISCTSESVGYTCIEWRHSGGTHMIVSQDKRYYWLNEGYLLRNCILCRVTVRSTSLQPMCMVHNVLQGQRMNQPGLAGHTHG
jgi:hypothetical protein